MPALNRVTIEPGIRSDSIGLEAVVHVRGGRNTYKRFPKGTKLKTIREWRHEKQREVAQMRAFANELQIRDAKRITRCSKPWCFIYFVRARDRVKIGRTRDIGKRMEALQTASSDPLTLLAAIPGHSSIEHAIQQRFQSLRLVGEWFQMNATISEFIKDLSTGVNPIAVLIGQSEASALRSPLDKRADDIAVLD